MKKNIIEYMGKNMSLKKLKDIKKSECITRGKLRKDFNLSIENIDELERLGKLHSIIIGETKYYKKAEILKLI